MARALDVAAYIVSKRQTIEAIKLQKLLYYSHAWHLVTMDTPLFDDSIRAFEYGPLVRNVWDNHRGLTSVSRRHLPAADESALSLAEKEVVDAVMAAYGQLSGWQLADLTHTEDPWKLAREKRGDDQISDESMKTYYAREAVADSNSRTTPRIPRIPHCRVTYLRSDEFDDLADDLDEPDDISAVLAALRN